MALFKAQATMREIEQRLSLSLPGVTFVDSLDSNSFPIAKVSLGSDFVWLYIHDDGNGGRVDPVTGLAQRFYSPHQCDMLKDARGNQIITATVTAWGAGGTARASINGVQSPNTIAFDTNNNQSAADLAADIASQFPGQVLSATSSSGVITVTALPGMTLTLTVAVAGALPPSVAIVNTYSPNADLRIKVEAAAAKLGMKLNIWSVNPNPSSFTLSGATLISTIRSDEINPLTESQ